MNRRNNGKSFIQDQYGYSLIEVIVVLAIVAVLAGVSTNLLGLLPGAQVKGCTKEVLGRLEKTKTNAMSYQSAWLKLYQGANGLYYAETVVMKGGTLVKESPQEIGKSDVQILYVLDGSGTENLLGTDGMMFSFDRSSGSFLEARVADDEEFNNCSTLGKCTELIIRKGSHERKLKLTYLTGKIAQE